MTMDNTLDSQSVADQSNGPPVRFHPSAGFCEWLAQENVSLAFTSTMVNKLITVGQDEKRLKIFTRTIDHVRAICARQDRLYVAARNAVWTYVDVAAGGKGPQGYDSLYYPMHCHMTGPVDPHDLYAPADPAHSLILANTRFSCLAEIDQTYNFKPLWAPSFISALMPEDRCHLSGVAVDPDTARPRYVTVAAQSDTYEAWRLKRVSGGAVLDVEKNRAILTGLSMPHAPRLHQGRLYVLDSGRGCLGQVDVENNALIDIYCFPGVVKGLALIGHYAVVSVSGFVQQDSVNDLPFFRRMQDHEAEKQCALHIVDLNKKVAVHALHITGALTEIDGLTVLYGRQNPAIVSPESDTVGQIFYLPDDKITASKIPAAGDENDSGFDRKNKKNSAADSARLSLINLPADYVITKNDNYSLINVYGRMRPEIKNALVEYWLAHKILPRDEDHNLRAAQACLLALNPKGQIIADLSAYQEEFAAVQMNGTDNAYKDESGDIYFFLRTSTAPEYRSAGLIIAILLNSHDVLKKFAAQQYDAQQTNTPKGVIIVTENEKFTRPLILKRFERYGYEILPIKTKKGQMLIRKKF
ncbi:MAG: TIGR03032 family protein [Micavibrio sp.]|nr:TIGR03032 family protein [Micavibrio sp.]|tara:strand:- start:1210 stop:2961 length:1752 start_codon:yes stop_codon:yes gene_type:complete